MEFDCSSSGLDRAAEYHEDGKKSSEDTTFRYSMLKCLIKLKTKSSQLKGKAEISGVFQSCQSVHLFTCPSPRIR